MPLNLEALRDAPRLLIEAELEPLQGTRFQPTGFPNLGAARYQGPDGREMLLVESAQSMANRLETVCWDEPNGRWVEPLKDAPVVKVLDEKKQPLTYSVLEAHRLNSVYIENSEWFSKLKSEIGYEEKTARSIEFRGKVYPTILKYDPNSLIHGFFLESIAGVIRSPRVLSAFIEAKNINVASSGGVKTDRLDATGKAEGGGAKEGYGHVPFARDEYTGKIVAYFNLDLAQIRAFGFRDFVQDFLIAFALFKIRAFFTEGLRLRTACDLRLADLKVTAPAEFVLPDLKALKDELPKLVQAVAGERLFADPPVTEVVYRKR